MSETTPELAAEVAAPAQEETKKLKRKLTAVAPAKGFKAYTSVGKHTYPFEIQIHGEVLQGQWSREDGFVEFLVPDDLVAGFEKHFHFTMGNLVSAE